MFFQTHDDSYSDLVLLVNDRVLCGADAPINFQHSSCTAAVQLEAGDVVNVKAIAGNANLWTGEENEPLALLVSYI